MHVIKALLAFTFATSCALAGTTEKIAVRHDDDLCDKLWNLPVIYQNDDASFLNEFRFTGRFHGDTYSLDSSVGADADWIVRRLRGGFKARFFHNLEIAAEVDLDPQNADPLYQRLTDTYVAYKFSEAFKLTLGKQRAKFTLDGSTSSNELQTLDRNNLTHNLWFTKEYVPGITACGKVGRWQYSAGIFTGGTASPEFGNFDAGNFGLISIGYDFHNFLGVKKALLRADYVYNDPNSESTFTRSFSHVGSLSFQLEENRWGLSADLSAGEGFGKQGDVWGANVQPWFNLSKKLQLVGRYTWLQSDDSKGIRLARYDSTVTKSKGDQYNEYYLGLNYLICGQRLKMQTGLSYVDMQNSAKSRTDYHAWTWTTGVRLSF